jgi:hypothetical protein
MVKKLVLIGILIFSINSYANNGYYLSIGAAPTYGSSADNSKSSMTGIGITAAGGIRMNNLALELVLKQIAVDNSGIGDENYDSEVKNFMGGIGTRMFMGDFLCLKAGVVNQSFTMDIYRDNQHLSNKEFDGSTFGFYVGMGGNVKMDKMTDIYFESTLIPSGQDADMYFVDIEFGLRLYLF